MKLKMKFEIKYIHNDNTVVAIAKPTTFDKNLDMAAAQYIFLTGREPKTKLPCEFKGIARLKAGDSDDLEIGRKIARKKALRQAYSIYGNYALEIYRYLKRWTDEFLDLGLSAKIKSREQGDDIYDLTRKN